MGLRSRARLRLGPQAPEDVEAVAQQLHDLRHLVAADDGGEVVFELVDGEGDDGVDGGHDHLHHCLPQVPEEEQLRHELEDDVHSLVVEHVRLDVAREVGILVVLAPILVAVRVVVRAACAIEAEVDPEASKIALTAAAGSRRHH